MALGVLIGRSISNPQSSILVEGNASKSKLNALIDFINNEYVDKVDTDSIVNQTVDAILAKLDPHSVYVPAQEQEQVAQNMKGDFVGIGVNFYRYKDTIAVIKPIPNGPAEKAGIKAGDRILYAEKDKLFGKNSAPDSVFSKLKGAIGSKVQLTIYRKNTKQTLRFTVQREVIPVKSVDVAIMVKPSVGYIKLNRFAETTFKEFTTGLSKLQKKGVQTLIVDLRDNGGGYMEEAIAITDHFLKDNELIVFTKSKKGLIEKTYATSKGNFERGRIFILINENSASASEIIAGAIQDNDRGVIVGRRSFGKGLVQREMNFKDGSAVRLTVARYFTPSGRSIQKPYIKGNTAYFNEAYQRFLNGELYYKDSIKIADSLIFKTKKGKIVYGGGGIVPDVFVPLNTDRGEEHAQIITQSGMIGHFVFETLDDNRKLFQGLSFEAFLSQYDSKKYLQLFQKYLSANGLDLPILKTKSSIATFIQAEFARQLFGEDYFFKIILPQDTMVEKVLTKVSS